jgi:hypothetical protein
MSSPPGHIAAYVGNQTATNRCSSYLGWKKERSLKIAPQVGVGLVTMSAVHTIIVDEVTAVHGLE